MNQTFRIALALACALPALACAGQPSPRLARDAHGVERPVVDFAGGLVASPIGLVMTDFDADNDRATSRAEFDSGAGAAWPGLDVDGDGEASGLEFADWLRAVMGSDTAIPGRLAFDRDANGVISRAEFIAGLDTEFTRLDADGSGAVERAELVRTVQPGGMEMPATGARAFILRRPDGSNGGPAAPDGATDEDAGAAE